VQSLERLDTEASPEIAVRFFEVQALGQLGYRPELHRCLQCQKPVQPVVNCFSVAAGGLVCRDCGRAGGVGVEIGVDALKVLRVLQQGDYTLARRLRLGPELRAELEGLLRGYLQFVMERGLRSADFLNTLRREGIR
jgi:DNA repair protein RecO (recombination protein O)